MLLGLLWLQRHFGSDAMHPLDWAIVVAYIAWLVWDGVKRTARAHHRELLPRQPQPAVVGGRAVGDGDAAQRHHARRHDRPGLHRRHALHPVLFRPAARDDHPVA